MKVNWKEAGEMILNGASFAEIADKFGVSRQYVQMYYTKRKTGSSSYRSCERIVYAGIADFMRENHLSIARFARMVYKEPTISQVQSLRYVLIGRTYHVPLPTIGAILRCIGKPFEEVFKPVEREEVSK